MKRLEARDIKDMNLLKHYRIIRRWACRNNNLLDSFNKKDFKAGVYSYSWDNRRFNRLLKNGWIIVWRERNRTTQKYNLYKTSVKCQHLIQRMYRIMLGEEDIPTSTRRNSIMKGKTYSDKVLSFAINKVNKDKNR
jgi:hypothetical protein